MIKSVLATAALALCTACASTDAPAKNENDSLDLMIAALSGKSGLSAEEVARLEASVADKPLGSADNPVRAHMPPGQRAYLSRLRCENGKAPDFFRGGSAGRSIYGTIQDVYVVTCEDSAPEKTEIFIDMYHAGHQETRPVPGFDIKPLPLVEGEPELEA